MTITDKYRLRFPTMPIEHTFKAGQPDRDHRRRHQHELVSNTGRPNNVPVTLDTRASKVTLPIVGGYAALDRGRARSRIRRPPSAAPSRRRCRCRSARPRRSARSRRASAQTYEASTTANVISSAGDALLSVADPSSQQHRPPGQRLVRHAAAAAGPRPQRGQHGTAYANVGSSASPLSLLQYGGPISNDTVTLQFSQRVNANDALRTGAYSKTLTFTLSTTQP